jgi:hypothetical protein
MLFQIFNSCAFFTSNVIMFFSLGCKLTNESGHWFAASALLLNNDQLAQGPSGFWKNNTTTIKPE